MLDGLLAFSIPLIAFEATLNQLGVSTTPCYAAFSLATGIAHQIIFLVFECLQTLTTKWAIPVYYGNWWLNFIVLDLWQTKSHYLMGLIQALCALWVIDITVLSLIVLMLLEPVKFFLWVLSEDLTNKFILRQESEPVAHQHALMYGSIHLAKSFQ